MKIFRLIGKLLVASFWLLVLGNLASPLARPFSWLLDLCGLLLLLAHGLEWVAFAGVLRGRPWRDRLQVLLFGGAHLMGLAAVEAPQETA